MPDTSATKSVFLSKTLWLNLIMALAAFAPQVQAVIQSHAELYPMVFAAVNFVLRLVTSTGVQLLD